MFVELLVVAVIGIFANEQQLHAPMAKATVAAVIAAHPEVNSCDEESLTTGRALLVDWTAQRLNTAQKTTRWGRKSRGKVIDGRADRPNTDGLTYLRDDGQFEIYDVVAGDTGAGRCGATWDGHGPFAQGANGWWAPPQLGPEAGTPPPPVDETVQLRARITSLEAELTLSQAALAHETAKRADAERLLDALRAEPAPTCVVNIPGWARLLGLRVGCTVVR